MMTNFEIFSTVASLKYTRISNVRATVLPQYIDYIWSVSGNPDDGEDCGYVRSDWEWGDKDCDELQPYICEHLESM